MMAGATDRVSSKNQAENVHTRGIMGVTYAIRHAAHEVFRCDGGVKGRRSHQVVGHGRVIV